MWSMTRNLALYPGRSYPAIEMKKLPGKEETAEEQTKQSIADFTPGYAARGQQ